MNSRIAGMQDNLTAGKVVLTAWSLPNYMLACIISPEVINMNIEIGTKIKEFRLHKNMTQEALGRKLNVSAQAVSKWESGTTMPDIQLLPELSVVLGVSIDALFSMTDHSRMDRIDNMLEYERFIPEREFGSAEGFLKEKLESDGTRARAMLLLAQLYVKRAEEYCDLAAPLARQALLLNPDEKTAHNAIFSASHGPASDWNCDNHWELIQFYKDFLKEHPENPRTYLWLMDLLIHDGRTQEAKEVLAAMERVEHTYRTDLYAGLIAKEECDLPGALAHWDHMVEEFPDFWLAWFSRADCMARLCRYEEAVECYSKGLELQPSPKYVDGPESLAQIAEIQGDIPTAIAMRKKCIEICRTDWSITEGEWIDWHQREIRRLEDKLKPKK